MNQPTNHNSGIRKYLVWLFWIAVWQAANLLIHNNIIFVGPLDMIKALAEQAADPSFWTTILNSFVFCLMLIKPLTIIIRGKIF